VWTTGHWSVKRVFDYLRTGQGSQNGPCEHGMYKNYGSQKRDAI
jgi:hypothetical protein